MDSYRANCICTYPAFCLDTRELSNTTNKKNNLKACLCTKYDCTDYGFAFFLSGKRLDFIGLSLGVSICERVTVFTVKF